MLAKTKIMKIKNLLFPSWKKYSLLLLVITLIFYSPSFSQAQLTITGKVVDSADAVPLSGVSVVVQGAAEALKPIVREDFQSKYQEDQN